MLEDSGQGNGVSALVESAGGFLRGCNQASPLRGSLFSQKMLPSPLKCTGPFLEAVVTFPEAFQGLRRRVLPLRTL